MIKERVLQVLEYKSIGIEKFFLKIGMSSANFRGNARKTPLNSTAIENILSEIPDVNSEWLLTGCGEMLKSFDPQAIKLSEKKLIPFYDDISTIGGNNDIVADVYNGNASISEWIDAGDWFPEATAAIRHYGDSMVEYPSGSILALKRVMDRRLILNGRNYVIETTEFRVTKQLQDDGSDFIMAYSSNKETYPDGRQIHSPIKIPKETIRYVDLVLGCVTKEYSNGAIAIKK